jgi:hypothetical protein
MERVCGAGRLLTWLLTCGGWQSASIRTWRDKVAKRGALAAASRRRINNPPQINNLPHKLRAPSRKVTGLLPVCRVTIVVT